MSSSMWDALVPMMTMGDECYGSGNMPAWKSAAAPICINQTSLRSAEQTLDPSHSSASSEASALRTACTVVAIKEEPALLHYGSGAAPTIAASAPLQKLQKLQVRAGAGGKRALAAAASDNEEDDDSDGFCCSPGGQQLKRKGGGGGGGGGGSGSCLVKGSHSNVEKSRRDRMNTLIDMLGEEVPPAHGCVTGAGNRRPKHAVLSDTLDLLLKMKQSIRQYEQMLGNIEAPEQQQHQQHQHQQHQQHQQQRQQHQQQRHQHQHQHQQLNQQLQQQEQQQQQQIATAEAAAAQAQAQVQEGVRRSRLANGDGAQAHWGRPQGEGQAEDTGGDSDCVQKREQQRDVDMANRDGYSPSPSPSPVGPEPPSASAEALLDMSPTPQAELLPAVLVSELSAGKFHVAIRCLYRADLHTEIVEELNALSVSLDHAAFSVPPAPSDAKVAEVELRVRSRPGCCVTAEGLHLAMYMAASCECPLHDASSMGGHDAASMDGSDARWSGLAFKMEELQGAKRMRA